jgi:signal peptidase I
MKKKRLLRQILTIASACILIIILGLFGWIFVSRVRGNAPGIFGYTFHLVVTDSMTPEINVNDLVIAKKASLSDFAVGDDVVFVTSDPSLNGITIVHRVVGIHADGSLITQGVKTGAGVDPYPARNVIGKVVAVSTFWGKVFALFTKNRNIVFGVALLMLLAIILSEIIQISRTVTEKKLLAEKEKAIGAKSEQNTDESKKE